MATTNVNIDLDALKAEVDKLTKEEITQQLLELKTKQRVQQKKYHNPEAAKKYQQKRAASFKLMSETAKAAPATAPGYANLYEQIVAEAKVKADAMLAEDAAEAEPVEPNEA